MVYVLRRLAVLIAVLLFPFVATGQYLVYQQSEPAVVIPGKTDTYLLQVLAVGATRVTFESVLTPGTEVDMKDDGTGGDRVAGDGLYSISLPVAPYLALLRDDDVFRLFIGYMRPYGGTAAPSRYNTFIDVFGSQVPSFPVTRDAPDMQHTDYLVNFTMPSAFPPASDPRSFPDASAVTSRFYSMFPDDVDIINVVYFPSYFLNRSHDPLRNAVKGVGLPLFDNSQKYGSVARLKGISYFPLTGYYDGANVGFQHELTHQWVNFMNVPPFASGIPHWPYSTMASGLMGVSLPPTGEGGTFPCLIVPDSTGVHLVFNPDQPVHNDLDLYLMGLLPPEQVGEQIVLNVTSFPGCNATFSEGSFTRVHVEDLISNPSIGPRDPDSTKAQKTFRTATILVTRDELLSPEAMSLYSLFTQRAELTTPTAIHEGLVKAVAKPFALSTRGLGTLVSRLPQPFPLLTLPSGGGAVVATDGAPQSTKVGYARFEASPGSSAPAGFAIFGLRENGILISEAGVPAGVPINSGRIYAEQTDAIKTGIAIANPNDSPATINFFFTDSKGNDVGSGTATVPANGQLASFLDQSPFNGSAPFLGAFTFASNVVVGVTALRGLTNERGEFLMSTLPVIDITAPAQGPQVLAHYADSGGWTTQVLLVNPGNTLLTGAVLFFDPSGLPANVSIAGKTGNSFAYAVPPRSSQKLSTEGAAANAITGPVRVVPDGLVPDGAAAPVPLVVFSYRAGGITESEAGVPVSKGTAMQMYVEVSGTPRQPGNIQSGIAIANPASSSTAVTVALTQLDGTPAQDPVSLNLPASGQTAKLLTELFPGVATPFRGILRIMAGTPGVSATGLRLHYNERAEVLISTTPPAADNNSSSPNEIIFPHFADGGGFTTQFILFNGGAGQSSGTLRLYDQNGQSSSVVLQPH
jgi:hypothetical protein